MEGGVIEAPAPPAVAHAQPTFQDWSTLLFAGRMLRQLCSFQLAKDLDEARAAKLPAAKHLGYTVFLDSRTLTLYSFY